MRTTVVLATLGFILPGVGSARDSPGQNADPSVKFEFGTTLDAVLSDTVDAQGQARRYRQSAGGRRRESRDPLVLRSLRDALETEGHVVTAADGGRAGIDAVLAAQAQGNPFPVVITDLGMPYVDGRKVASTVKGTAPDTAVLMLTGWGQRLLIDGEIPPHVDHVLSKPPKLRELRAALMKCMRKERN